MESQYSIEGSVYDLPLLSCGVSSMVYGVSEFAVVKAPCGTDESRRELAIERTIFDRLGSHPYTVKLLHIHEGMIVLECLQYPLRKRLWDLRAVGELPLAKDVLRWATQITQALRHAHSRAVFQVDIGPHNMLLDWHEDVKLSDFAGSSIDGSTPSVVPSPHSEHPKMPATQPSIKSEMFALGSSLYEIETTQQPYHNKTDQEIEELFGADSFPDTSALLLGEVISKCWAMKYKDVSEALDDIRRLEEHSRGQNISTVGRQKSAWWKKRVSSLAYHYLAANGLYRPAILSFGLILTAAVLLYHMH